MVHRQVELISEIVLYAIGLPPGYGLDVRHHSLTTDSLKTDEMIHSISKDAHTQVVRCVDETWVKEVDCILHKYGAVDTENMRLASETWADVLQEFDGQRLIRLQRLLLRGRNCSVEDIQGMSNVLLRITNLTQLRVHLHLSSKADGQVGRAHSWRKR